MLVQQHPYTAKAEKQGIDPASRNAAFTHAAVASHKLPDMDFFLFENFLLEALILFFLMKSVSCLVSAQGFEPWTY